MDVLGLPQHVVQRGIDGSPACSPTMIVAAIRRSGQRQQALHTDRFRQQVSAMGWRRAGPEQRGCPRKTMRVLL
jgi:hypothetical protein